MCRPNYIDCVFIGKSQIKTT